MSETVLTDPTAKHAAAKFDISAFSRQRTLSQAFSESLVRDADYSSTWIAAAKFAPNGIPRLQPVLPGPIKRIDWQSPRKHMAATRCSSIYSLNGTNARTSAPKVQRECSEEVSRSLPIWPSVIRRQDSQNQRQDLDDPAVSKTSSV